MLLARALSRATAVLRRLLRAIIDPYREEEIRRDANARPERYAVCSPVGVGMFLVDEDTEPMSTLVSKSRIRGNSQLPRRVPLTCRRTRCKPTLPERARRWRWSSLSRA